MRAKLKEVKADMRRRMHHSLPEQERWLASVLTGHYQYYGVPGNTRALSRFRFVVVGMWIKALRRRSHRQRVTWERMTPRIKRGLPRPAIMHPWPEVRFDAKHP